MTPEQKKEIDEMTQIQACRLWRFAPSGHPYFVSDTEVYTYFKKRFDELGGMTPEISKLIRWGD